MNYYKQPIISNSSLGYINPEEDGYPQKLKSFLDGTLPQLRTQSLENGELVHKYKLEPNEFDVLPMNKPSDAICDMIDKVFREIPDATLPLESYKDVAGVIILESDYQTNWKPETRIAKVIEAGSEYFGFLIQSTGKRLIDFSTHEVIKSCVASISRNESVSKLLDDSQLPEGCEAHNEYEIYWEPTDSTGNSHKAKSKLDRIILNHKKKTFTIVDLKTLSKNINRYPQSFKYWHTYRQLAFYIDAAQSVFTEFTPSENHYIAAVMTSMPYTSRVFQVSSQGDWVSDGRTEYKSLLDRVTVHQSSQNWEDDMETIQGQCVWTINYDKNDN